MSTGARAATRLVRAAEDLYRHAPWFVFDPKDAFLLEVPGEEQPLTAFFQAEGEVGMALLRDGFAGARALRADRLRGSIGWIALIFAPLQEIPRSLRGLLEAARWRGRRDWVAPYLLVKEPGEAARGASVDDTRIALYAACAVVRALDQAALEPVPFATSTRLPILRVSGDPLDPVVRYDTWEVPREPARVPPPRDNGSTWCVGTFPFPPTLLEDAHDVQCAVVADRDSGEIRLIDLVTLLDSAATFVRLLRDREDPPPRIECRDEALARALDDAGVPGTRKPDQPALDAIGADLERLMEDHVARADAMAWECEIRQLPEILEGAVLARRLSYDRAVAAYFGDLEFGRAVLDDDDEEWFVPSFAMWTGVAYRPRDGSPTCVEWLLAHRRLTGRARGLLEALRDARPAIFLVDEVNDDDTVLLDLATGEPLRVRQEFWGWVATRGSIVAGIPVTPGSHAFVVPLSTVLYDFRSEDIPGRLADRGIEPTPEDLAARPGFAGELARYYAELREELDATTDDEWFRLVAGKLGLGIHRAEFRMADPDSALAALRSTEGVALDEETGHGEWEVPVEGSSLPDFLAHWQQIDDCLVVTCETEDAFERTRAMLESIPGVRMRSEVHEPFGSDHPSAVPLDDRPGIDEINAARVDPVVVDWLKELQLAVNRKWLDQPNRALGGRTPREAGADPAAAARLRFLVRTRPVVHPSVPLDVVEAWRREAFSDLGLGG